MPRPPAPLALLAPLALAAAACGGSGGSGETASTTVAAVPKSPLLAAAQATARQPSERVELRAKVDLFGQPVSLSGAGAFARGDRGELNLSLKVPSLPASTLDEVFRGHFVWLSSPLLTSSLHGKHWIRVDTRKDERALGFDLNEITAQTPSSVLATFRLPGRVSTVGKALVDGIETTHYRKSLSARVAGTVYRSLDAWVDARHLLRRVRLDYTPKVDPTSGRKGARTLLTMDFSHYGAPVAAPLPARGDVIDASEVSG